MSQPSLLERSEALPVFEQAAPKPQASDSEAPEALPQLYDPSLPTDLSHLRQKQVPALDLGQHPNFYKIPRPPSSLFESLISNGNNNHATSSHGAPALDPYKVLLVIPTANESKTELLCSRLSSTKPAHVQLSYCQVKADSGVGEQPYDEAGPRGAFNRAVNAVAALLGDEERRAALVEDRGVGTLIVGAIENFVLRHGIEPRPGRSCGPVDHGFVVLCRVSLLDKTWEWVVGVSRGVTVPWEYYSAAQKLGFEDEGEGEGEGETKTCGKVTVGKLLLANAGVDDANWYQALAGVSRYDLLGEVLKAMDVPWPAVTPSGA
ncbi:hypothetical protein L209DRAFT_693846 [Thermothelomyces heterothallicus CBS 203.75]